ncbi:DUF1707 SHOCT-like domain-containing protein [Nocardia asteroides]|uniref:DUF1707 SHOCT-like domain-containing protein n=1 Tax=Nocardia asteroides TaxID=1824 RepID=UPI001E5F44EB|nr:DUF1707 domain-containing protein [Nocardia asteroides]UGT63644.1 DUF1707 domain-containing protein [Nocardia asteroides]
MTDGDDIRLSDEERLHALNVLGEHYAAGRLDGDEFYERSGAVAAGRTVGALREPFRGLPGGVPLREEGGSIRRVGDAVPQPLTKQEESSPAAELESLRHRGKVVETVDGVILGLTLLVFLVLQFAVDWSWAWLVWPSLAVTLSVSRLLYHFGDEDEKMYKELKKADAKSRRKRLEQAGVRIRELEDKRDES